MRRILFAVVLAATLLGVAGGVIAQTIETSAEVRIVARRLDDGRTEFALQQRDGDGWGERILPARRYFPADPGHSRWLASSEIPITVEAPTSTTATATPATTESDFDGWFVQHPTCPSEIAGVRCYGSGFLFDLPAGTYGVATAAVAAAEFCSLWIETESGDLEQIRTPSARGQTNTIVTVGTGYRYDVSPGRAYIDPIGCTAARALSS